MLEIGADTYPHIIRIGLFNSDTDTVVAQNVALIFVRTIPGSTTLSIILKFTQIAHTEIYEL